MRVLALLQEGQLDAALQQANTLVQRFPDHAAVAEAYYTRARVHAKRQELTAAISDLTAAIERCSLSPHTRLCYTVARGRCYEHDGMCNAAAEDYAAVYQALVAQYRTHNTECPTDPLNYMDIIQFFWSARQGADQDLGFPQLQFKESGSYRDVKRARQEAVLRWLLGFVAVDHKITANIGNVDVHLFSLEGEDDEGPAGWH